MDLATAVANIEAATDALDLVAVDSDAVDQSPSGELREVLRRLKVVESRVGVLTGRLSHAADSAGAFIGTGARDTAEWLAKQTGTSARRNRNAAEVGKALTSSEELSAAIASGRVSADKASMIVGAAGEEPVDADLVESVADLPLNAVKSAVEAWRARINPEHDADVAAIQRTRRYVRLTSQADGMTKLDGLLDPESGAIVRATLDGVMNQFAADRTTHTRDQRCADALTQLCAAGSKGEITGGRSNTKLLATVPFETIVERGDERGHTHVGPTLDPATVRKLACHAGIHRVITGPGSSLLDFGHETRLVPDNLFYALVARDQRCRWPGCTVRATWCDAHHIVEWVDHGPTTDENCVLLCHRHHQLSHEPGWQIRGDAAELQIRFPDGSTEVSRPPPAYATRADSIGRDNGPDAGCPPACTIGRSTPPVMRQPEQLELG